LVAFRSSARQSEVSLFVIPIQTLSGGVLGMHCHRDIASKQARNSGLVTLTIRVKFIVLP
jgi:hypothetical protein